MFSVEVVWKEPYMFFFFCDFLFWCFLFAS